MSATASSTSPARTVAERPLPSVARLLLMAGAALTILLFYMLVLLSVVVMACMIACECLFMLALMRFGVGALMMPVVKRHASLPGLLLGRLWLRNEKGPAVSLVREDAPRLFELIEDLSAKVGVPPPREVQVEMTASAWVRLDGVMQASTRTVLGLGYDLMLVLTPREMEAVLAHEMTHARLVRRGLKRWLGSGLRRAAGVAGILSATVDAHQRVNVGFAPARCLLFIFHPLTRLAARQVAAYSRQDEFDADHGAALLCGGDALVFALRRLDRVTTHTARIGWTERLAAFQAPGGFTNWLSGQLQRAEESGPVPGVPLDCHSPYSTHPTTADRAAALGIDLNAEVVEDGTRASDLLADPEGLARRIVSSLRAFMEEEEKRDLTEGRRWLSQVRRGARIRNAQWLGVLVVVLGVCVVFPVMAEAMPAWGLVACPALIAGGVFLYRFFRYKDRALLPLPSFATLIRATRRPFPTDAEIAARVDELGAGLDACCAGVKGRSRRHARYLELCHEALLVCDYLRANAAARKALDQRSTSVDAMLGIAISCAGLGRTNDATTMLGFVNGATGLHSRVTRLGAAWALWLLGGSHQAEALLAEEARGGQLPASALALLANCEWNRGKLSGALIHAKAAIAGGEDNEETRLLLSSIHVARGELAEAEETLGVLGDDALKESELALVRLRLALLRRSAPAVERVLGELGESQQSGHVHVSIASLCEEVREYAMAARHYGLALDQGHYPEALLGLARLARQSGKMAEARERTLAALVVGREQPHRACGLAEIFDAGLGMLLSLEPVADKQQAWIASIRHSCAVELMRGHCFLVYAPDHASAALRLDAVLGAMYPQGTRVPAADIGWAQAPRHQWPVGPVSAGIQSHWHQAAG